MTSTSTSPARTGRRRPATVVAVLALLAMASGVLVGCSSSDSGSPPSSDGAGTTPTTATPSTTEDPLAATVVDGCGNDLSDLTGTVWGIDPTTGEVRWTTEVPLPDTYLLTSAAGDPLVPLVLRRVEVALDATTGEIVDTPTAGSHEVVVDVSGATGAGQGGLVVDGEAQPATITVGTREMSTARGETGQTTVGVTAVDASTGALGWRTDVGAADAVGSISPPVLYGDTVVVTTAAPRPACP